MLNRRVFWGVGLVNPFFPSLGDFGSFILCVFSLLTIMGFSMLNLLDLGTDPSSIDDLLAPASVALSVFLVMGFSIVDPKDFWGADSVVSIGLFSGDFGCLSILMPPLFSKLSLRDGKGVLSVATLAFSQGDLSCLLGCGLLASFSTSWLLRVSICMRARNNEQWQQSL